ncbi:MAG: hypothetical protein LUD18_13650 [Lachnospiraceae bacterium]|nr:hypothetical protein [Lachnospiraceae bacterium]
MSEKKLNQNIEQQETARTAQDEAQVREITDSELDAVTGGTIYAPTKSKNRGKTASMELS